MKISYLGPLGTNCYDACKIYNADDNNELIPAKTITEAITLLLEDSVDECIVPIENSIKGTVIETLDNIFENEEIYIKKELIIDINHCLLGYPNNSNKVYSHAQALGQCRRYISNNLKSYEIVEVESTAKGAQIVHDTKEGLCISSKTCAELYNLDIIDENIQDRNNNQTRFFVLTKNKEHREENVKVSMVFSTKHIPGALYQILGLLNTFEINMTKIESRPSEKQLGDYWFWIDTTMENLNKKTDVFFEILNTKCSYFRILGMY